MSAEIFSDLKCVCLKTKFAAEYQQFVLILSSIALENIVSDDLFRSSRGFEG